MKEQGEIANMESCEPKQEKIRLQIFNHVSRNGHIYIADTKEDVLKVFGKFIDQKAPLCLTDQLQGPDFDRKNMSPDDYREEFGVVNLQRVAGIFKDIEIVETGKRYILQLAENIPIAPVHHYFESKKDWRYYSLFFPSIPHQDCTINIIEVENGLFRDFNYYGVKLRMEEGMEILE